MAQYQVYTLGFLDYANKKGICGVFMPTAGNDEYLQRSTAAAAKKFNQLKILKW